jgi:hypothetical protein
LALSQTTESSLLMTRLRSKPDATVANKITKKMSASLWYS